MRPYGEFSIAWGKGQVLLIEQIISNCLRKDIHYLKNQPFSLVPPGEQPEDRPKNLANLNEI